ncbi:MAG: glycosyltransferase [Vicinamibacterales bacterium]
MPTKDLPVVVVTWNRVDRLQTWLETFKALIEPTGYRKRAIIVDNASSDTTPTVIATAISDRLVRREDVWFQPSNYGFAPAHNLVFRNTILDGKADFIATLNEDATAAPAWLAALVNFATTSPQAVGMWGGPIHQPEPNTQVISSAGHCLRDDGAFLDIDWNVAASSAKCYTVEGFEPFTPCFAAALWSTKMLREVGLLDDDQFVYYDDVDLGYRARLGGWRAAFVREAMAHHPLPSKKQSGSRLWVHQQKGRLAIVCRYLPDAERTRILSILSPDLRAIYDEALWEGRRYDAIGNNQERTTIWTEWLGKHCRSGHARPAT